MPKQNPTPKAPIFEHQKDSNFRSLYVNSVQIQLSFFDMKITLSEVQRVEADKVHVLDHAIMYMSLEHARSLQRLLAEQLDKYEEQFGEIRTPPAEAK